MADCCDDADPNIFADLSERIKAVQDKLPVGVTFKVCALCGEEIPLGRQKALPGVKLCVECAGRL